MDEEMMFSQGLDPEMKKRLIIAGVVLGVVVSAALVARRFLMVPKKEAPMNKPEITYIKPTIKVRKPKVKKPIVVNITEVLDDDDSDE